MGGSSHELLILGFSFPKARTETIGAGKEYIDDVSWLTLLVLNDKLKSILATWSPFGLPSLNQPPPPLALHVTLTLILCHLNSLTSSSNASLLSLWLEVASLGSSEL